MRQSGASMCKLVVVSDAGVSKVGFQDTNQCGIVDPQSMIVYWHLQVCSYMWSPKVGDIRYGMTRGVDRHVSALPGNPLIGGRVR